MRPTNLGFRSPERKTPEFYVYQMTRYGNKLSFANPKGDSKRKEWTTFGQSMRFPDHQKMIDKQSPTLGPGTYNPLENFVKLTNKPCSTKITKLSIGREGADGQYHYVGDRLVYEPSF